REEERPTKHRTSWGTKENGGWSRRRTSRLISAFSRGNRGHEISFSVHPPAPAHSDDNLRRRTHPPFFIKITARTGQMTPSTDWSRPIRDGGQSSARRVAICIGAADQLLTLTVAGTVRRGSSTVKVAPC